ncbi:MAG: hypothetical protein IKM59_01610 [Oscillospiraceae bacterium]|nr:hypothetical protein [Oscillospiraceae bacterium]
MRKKSKASLIALCGVLAALALVCLFLGGSIPAASISCPVLASLVLIPVYLEWGWKWGMIWYAAVGILGLLIAPMKECAILFVAFGYYPLLRKPLGRLPFSKLFKLLYFNAVLILAYGMMLFVFSMPELKAEFADMGRWMLVVMAVLANISFFLYDILVSRVEVFYLVRMKPKLRFV